MKQICKIDVVARNGVPFRVVYLPEGIDSENFPGACKEVPYLAHVEFYDRRHPHTPDGQFTGGRYFLSGVLLNQEGINLYGGVADWIIDERAMKVIHAWLVNVNT